MKEFKSGAVILVAILLACFQSFAQDAYETWPIEEAAVYESGVRLVRSGAVQLDDNGRAAVTLGGLAESIDESMVQVDLPPNWSLVSSLFRRAPSPDELKSATTALEVLIQKRDLNGRTHAMRSALFEAYQEELLMIQANRKVAGNELLLVEDLLEHADFWRSRVKELKYLMLDLKLEMEMLTEEREVLETQIVVTNAKGDELEGQLVLQLSGPENGQANVAVDYLARDASWEAVYDASVDAEGSIGFKRFVKVRQSTGNEWLDVPLTFTVGRPTQSLAPPELRPQLLTIAQSQSTNAYEWAAEPELNKREDRALASFDGDAFGNGIMSATAGALERYEFIPENMVFVAGTGKPERIFIDEFSLNGQLTHLVLPVVSDQAYQLVSVTGWSQQRLLPGAVNILTDGVYRGAFEMNLPTPGDTLRLPLGQDQRVRCSRNRLIDLCSSAAFGGSRKTTQSFEIMVENQHNRMVDVTVEDHVPVSNSTDVSIEVLNLDGGELDPVTGKITWVEQLAPMESRRFVFSYTVTFPKRHVLRGL